MVQRSFVSGRVDAVETEYSKDYVPLDPGLEGLLLEWRTFTPYEYLCKLWTQIPDRFTLNPIHQMLGLNT